jgi:hypothetical protein
MTANELRDTIMHGLSCVHAEVLGDDAALRDGDRELVIHR